MLQESLERKHDSVNDLRLKSLNLARHVSMSSFVLPPRELHWKSLMTVSLGTEIYAYIYIFLMMSVAYPTFKFNIASFKVVPLVFYFSSFFRVKKFHLESN